MQIVRISVFATHGLVVKLLLKFVLVKGFEWQYMVDGEGGEVLCEEAVNSE